MDRQAAKYKVSQRGHRDGDKPFCRKDAGTRVHCDVNLLALQRSDLSLDQQATRQARMTHEQRCRTAHSFIQCYERPLSNRFRTAARVGILTADIHLPGIAVKLPSESSRFVLADPIPEVRQFLKFANF